MRSDLTRELRQAAKIGYLAPYIDQDSDLSPPNCVEGVEETVHVHRENVDSAIHEFRDTDGWRRYVYLIHRAIVAVLVVDETSKVEWVFTAKHFRRRGLARELFIVAYEQNPLLRHDADYRCTKSGLQFKNACQPCVLAAKGYLSHNQQLPF